jgi:poly-gamma-glutamate synthesis protein (capsule biosynthesis protein)
MRFASAILASLFALSAFCASDAPSIRLILGGDVMLARWVWRTAQQHNDPLWPFLKIADEFRAADLAFVNLESPFSETGPYFQERMVFRANPIMIEGLKHAGIDIVSTANNHSRDAVPRGIEFTLEHLAKNGIAAVGTTPAAPVLERKGVKFGFLAYTYDQRNGNYTDDDPRVAMIDLKTIGADVQSMRKRSDVVIVSMHAGWEYHTKPNWQQRQFARAAIDAGAAVVVGHHPHVVQPAERYKHGVIFYSLGNFVFDQQYKPGVREGAVGEVVFSGANIESFRLRDLQIRKTVPELSGPIVK